MRWWNLCRWCRLDGWPAATAAADYPARPGAARCDRGIDRSVLDGAPKGAPARHRWELDWALDWALHWPCRHSRYAGAIAADGAGSLDCGALLAVLRKSRHSLAIVVRNSWRCTTMSTRP